MNERLREALEWALAAGTFVDQEKYRWACAALASTPIQQAGAGLSFEAFSETNRQRCESPKGFNHQLSSWSTSDWFLALLGELGEAANIAKKLNRVRDGIPGNKVSAEELRTKLRQELGDAFVYLDLLCQSVGVAIGEAATEVFNTKSQELGCPILLASPSPASAEGEKS